MSEPHEPITVGSLFSGIGGIELGLRWAGGFETRWFCEADPYCRRVLAKHWPGVPCYEDIKAMDESTPPVDMITGGFPCQDISYIGKGAGIDGERSGLFFELMRIVRMVRPRYVLLENVPALLGRGMGRVLGALAESGHDAEWECISAAAVGAPHIRERVFILAYAERKHEGRIIGREEPSCRYPGLCWDANGNNGETRIYKPVGTRPALSERRWGADKPGLDRMAYGVPNRVDRLKGLGNAVVPQVAERAGRRIMEAHYERTA